MQIRLRPAPIAKMLGVMAVVASFIVLIYAALGSLPDFETISREYSWVIADLVHVPIFVIPFALICVITRGRLGEYGFNLRQKPPMFTHRRMFGLGVIFGLLLSLRYLSAVIGDAAVDVPQPATWVNVLGNLTFQWIVVGVSEETMFRGLIQTYLMNHLRGYVRIAGHELHIGTILGAVLWGGFHFINLLILPVGSVVFFVVLTTVAGLLMGYAYQETGSLLTTIIVHNTLFGVPITIGYILHWVL